MTATVKRHPIRGFLYGVVFGLGLMMIVVGQGLAALGTWPPFLVFLFGIVIGTVWSTYGPAKAAKGAAGANVPQRPAAPQAAAPPAAAPPAVAVQPTGPDPQNRTHNQTVVQTPVDPATGAAPQAPLTPPSGGIFGDMTAGSGPQTDPDGEPDVPGAT